MREVNGLCVCGPAQGQAQQQPLSSGPASRLAADAPQLAARITHAFGHSASDALTVSGEAAASPDVDLLTLAPQSERLGGCSEPSRQCAEPGGSSSSAQR